MHKLPSATTVALLLTGALTVGCGVPKEQHQALIAERNALQEDLDERNRALEESKKTAKTCDANLETEREQNAQLASKVEALGKDMGELAKEKEDLVNERMELSKEVAELRRMRQAAEAREQELKTLMSKLHEMIDAGTLEVKVRNGRMLVQLSSDVVFPPGSTRIKPDAKEALTELAQTLAQFEDRKFQVVGHSDATPIHTARFPSNWELSSQRAIEVVKLLIEEGVPPTIISAAGNAEYDPLVDDETPEAMSMNRRVEVVFLPKIEELPGFESALEN